MTKFAASSLLLAASLSTTAIAEPVALHCVYTQASFSAAYMSQPETRSCPENRCFYDLYFDTDSSTGRVNAVGGYRLIVEDDRYLLQREQSNQVVGGVDSASFTVNRDSLSYTSIKTTPPGVVLETSGQCQPIP